jgi:endonuclease YncB( thermonuclease family)
MSAPPIPAPPWLNAWVDEWHDGDTVIVRVDRWMRDYSTWNIRIHGMATLELAEPGGVEARDECARRWPPDTELVLATSKPDKYGGRFNADVYYRGPDGEPRLVSAELIADGWALPWDGHGPQPKPRWPR